MHKIVANFQFLSNFSKIKKKKFENNEWKSFWLKSKLLSFLKINYADEF